MAEAAGLNPVQRGFDPRRGYLGHLLGGRITVGLSPTLYNP